MRRASLGVGMDWDVQPYHLRGAVCRGVWQGRQANLTLTLILTLTLALALALALAEPEV